MSEDQKSIVAWCDEAFGPAASLSRVAARANEEMAELVRAVTADQEPEKCVIEAADVVIVLYRFAEIAGFDLHAMIDHKMQINRGREWKRDGTGQGYHVRDKSLEDKAQ